MCISILSTAHPAYPFILISNRDEYISRPTLRAKWWDAPHQQVLGGRDTQRAERGTWLGITKQGRIAILTNFRAEGVEVNKDKSRGAITNSYLCIPPESDDGEEAYVERLVKDVGIHDVGGFTLVFGKLRKPRAEGAGAAGGGDGGGGRASRLNDRLSMVRDHQSPLSSNADHHVGSPSQGTPHMPGLVVISNRTASPDSLLRIATTQGETHGLSNSHYGDLTWPKVVLGEQLLREAITSHSQRGDSQEALIQSLFDILSVDKLPKRRNSEDWNAYVRHMRDSILISPAKGELAKRMANYIPASTSLKAATGGTGTAIAPDGMDASMGEAAYGTSKQTVILVDVEGKVVFTERTLYDEHGAGVPDSERDVRYEFSIEGWEDSS